jgi:hypothetical protein
VTSRTPGLCALRARDVLDLEVDVTTNAFTPELKHFHVFKSTAMEQGMSSASARVRIMIKDNDNENGDHGAVSRVCQ